MSHSRKAVIAAVAALALGGSIVASTAPAGAHDYSKEGTLSAKEASKLFKETFKQKCLTVHEALHIAHGSGRMEGYYPGENPVLTFVGTKNSNISSIDLIMTTDERCVSFIDAYKR